MNVQKQTVSVVSTNMKTKQKWRKRTVLYPSRYFFYTLLHSAYIQYGCDL